MGQFIYPDGGTQVIDHTVTPAEDGGFTIQLPSGLNVLSVFYNTLVMIPEPLPVDSQGFNYNPTSGVLTFGFPLNTGDVIQILYT
jgi:hypothetical protein